MKTVCGRLVATAAFMAACASGGALAASPRELEALLLESPFPQGARLGLVLASEPDVSMLHPARSAKSTPANSPSSYADLVFTALTPCRIYDSRSEYGGPGAWQALSTNTISIGPHASYAFQGGSAADCGMNATLNSRPIAAVMVAASTTGQARAGYLTFFSPGAANPFPYGVSQAYQPGAVQTSFVVIPTDVGALALASGYTSTGTDVVVDVVGYFTAPASGSGTAGTVTVDNINLLNSTATKGNILKAGERFIHNYGSENTFVGVLAGNFTMTGSGNTGIGYGALASNTSGNSNTAFGRFALHNNTSGNSNIGIGDGGGSLLTTGSDNIAIGHPGVAGESGTIRIGLAGLQTTMRIAGVRGVTTAVADGIPVVVSSEGQLGTINSSRRNKVDIAALDDVTDMLMKLRPVTFHYEGDRNPAGPILQYGLIAEEVAAVAPGLVARSRNGEPETVFYQFLTPMLVEAFQRQREAIEARALKIRELEADAVKMDLLERQLAALKAKLDKGNAQ